VAGDKAFAGQPSREHLRRRSIGAVIPTKSNQRRRRGFDREAYRARNRVERLFNRLKQFRRIATRYDKTDQSFSAMIYLAASLMALK
jgi:transposase